MLLFISWCLLNFVFPPRVNGLDNLNEGGRARTKRRWRVRPHSPPRIRPTRVRNTKGTPSSSIAAGWMVGWYMVVMVLIASERARNKKKETEKSV